MKIVLRTDVENVGNKGDLVDVADGFARNYLVPKGFALPASPGIQKQADAMRRSRDAKDRRDRESAEAIAVQLSGRTVTVEARAGEGGRLFGSITAADIADAVQAQLGVEIDRRRIALDEPLKELGPAELAVRLHSDVTAMVTVEVTARSVVGPGTLSPGSSTASSTSCARTARARVHPRCWRTQPSQSPWLWKRGRVVHNKDTGLFPFQPTGSGCEPATALGGDGAGGSRSVGQRASQRGEGQGKWFSRSTARGRTPGTTRAATRAAQGGGGRIPPHNLEAEESLIGAMMLLARGADRGGRGAHRRRATSTSPRTASSTTRRSCSTAGASRSTPSPSPRSCGGAGSSTRSAAGPTLLRIQAATPGVGQRRAVRQHRLRAVDAAEAHRDRGRHPAHGVRRRRRRRRDPRPGRVDDLRGRGEAGLRLARPALSRCSSRRWSSSKRCTTATRRSPACPPGSTTSTTCCSASSRRR